MYLDLILNLSLIIALTIVSTFFERRKSSKTKLGALLQGLLFGGVAVIGMLKPAVYQPGIIFDGRSVVLSLCALFFGAYAVMPALIISIIARICLGGDGMYTGVLTILFSSLAGLYYRRIKKEDLVSITTEQLLVFGFVTHFGVLLMLLTLKLQNLAEAIVELSIPYLLFFPFASVLAGKILSENYQIIDYIAKLKMLNSKQKAIFESIAEGVLVADEKARITEINQSAEKLLGINRDYAKGKHLLDIVSINDKNSLEKIKVGLNAALNKGNNSQICDVTFASNGIDHIINVDISPLKDEDKIVGVVFTLYDCTQERAAQQALMESKKKYETFLDACPLMIWTTDVKKSSDYFNPQWIKFRGVRLEAELDKGWFDGIHPDDIDEFVHKFSSAFEKRQECLLLYRLKNKNGEYRWINNYCYPQYDSNGNFVGYIGFALDVSEIKQTQSKVYLLLKALETIRYGIIITDKERRIEWVNPAFTEIMGYSLEEIRGKKPKEFLRSYLRAADFYESLDKAVTDGKIWQGEIMDRRKNGEICCLKSTIIPIRNDKNEIINFISIQEDLTNYKLLQEQLLTAQKMEIIGRLASGVAHDFNNALSIVKLCSDFLHNFENLSSDGAKNVDLIEKAIENASNIARRLLNFVRNKPSEFSVIDLNETIGGLCKVLQRLLGENIKIKIDLFPSKLLIQGDRSLIEQVIMNLAINAKDAMPNGGILEIKLDSKYIENPRNSNYGSGEYAIIDVIDTGTGISPEILPHIFRPLFTTKEQGKGTGLGLSIVQDIVSQHRGWIEVHSVVGAGSKFTIYLPMYAEKVLPAKQAKIPEKNLIGTETILIIEDDNDVRELITRVLTMYGYKVISADTGENAIEKFNELNGKIDLLLTDIILPGIPGYRVAKELMNKNPNLKVIFMSGYPGELSTDFKDGLNFLLKPVNEENLLESIRAAFNKIK
ncbi:MAG TPA: PAS domain S-box protein [Verrucomicrobiota bacterium]|nr:PAS domain S-box protein [Verrucomicrobiota bacterium]